MNFSFSLQAIYIHTHTHTHTYIYIYIYGNTLPISTLNSEDLQSKPQKCQPWPGKEKTEHDVSETGSGYVLN
jgi:hypothetical protein